MTPLTTSSDARAVHVVRIGDAVLAAPPARLVARGLGSCVAIILHAPDDRLGALAHVLLPARTGRETVESSPARAVESAVPWLLARLRDEGARGTVEARLVGGASMFGELLAAGDRPLGARNVCAARAALAAAGVPLVGEDTGGTHGRSVEFDLADGRVVVRSLRGGDVVV